MARTPVIFRRRILVSLFVAALCLRSSGAPAPKPAPQSPPPAGPTNQFDPFSGHPWNVFLAGERTRIPLPAPDAKEWTLWDYDGRQRMTAPPARGWAEIGPLPPGYYEVRETTPGRSARVGLAVLSPLGISPPPDSPISLDVASAWRFGEGQRELAANLCRLLGINWVRDRFNWMEMEPERDVFRQITSSDVSVATELARGLRVLQVNHFTPKWANPNPARFPLDLRDAYNFYFAAARRWSGRVSAFEPWNEPDIDVFGAHIGSQIAAFQKAAYLGIKAGNPQALVCQSVFATPNDAILEDLQENETWPYFDTLNFHYYGPLENYSRVFAEFRSVSAGKPLWLTECNLPLHWSGDPQLQELSDDDARLQAERLPKVYTAALNEGVANIFYFTLGHYAEGSTQYGLLRGDGTPEPALVALGAVSRFMATAKPMGRFRFGDSAAVAYCFGVSLPEGPRELMVLWSTNTPVNVAVPRAPLEAYDFLGRAIKSPPATFKCTARTRYMIFPEGSFAELAIEPPPRPPARRDDPPGFVVMQPPMLRKVNQGRSAYRLGADKENRIQVDIYNFSDRAVEGEIHLTTPTNWAGQFATTLRLEPGAKAEEFLILNPRGNKSDEPDVAKLEGDFGDAGRSVLALRVAAERFDLSGLSAQLIPAAVLPARWIPVVSGGGTMKMSQADGGLLVEGLPASDNRYVHPEFALEHGERMDQDCVAVAARLELIEGTGDFYVIFNEANGSSYLSDFEVQPRPGETIDEIARVDLATWGATWSNADEKARLDPRAVKSIMIGCSTKSPSVKFIIKDLRWLRRLK
jgi:hypothetical protein